MLAPDLEKLIDLAVADGVITEQERRVLYRKVEETGADFDEFEMVLEAKLFMARDRMKNPTPVAPPPPPPPAPVAARPAPVAPPPIPASETKPSTPSTPKPHTVENSNKAGERKKCPACGAPYVTNSLNCPECGHEFTGLEGNPTVVRFAEMLREIELRYANKKPGSILTEALDRLGIGNDSRVQEICTAIHTFPIPVAKEDLVEFILFLHPKAQQKVKWGFLKSNTPLGLLAMDDAIKEAYQTKYQECITKASFYIADDEALVEKLSTFGINIKRNKRFGFF